MRNTTGLIKYFKGIAQNALRHILRHHVNTQMIAYSIILTKVKWQELA